MNTLRLVASFALLSLITISNAQEKSDIDQIDELFDAMKASSMVDMMYQQIGGMMEGMQQQLNVTKDEMPIFEKYNNKMVDIMRTEMSWEKMEPDIRNIYLQNFTSDEINALVDFYKSPTGQKFVEKMPNITQESMIIGQQMALQAMPAIQQVAEEFQAEITEYRAQNTQ